MMYWKTVSQAMVFTGVLTLLTACGGGSSNTATKPNASESSTSSSVTFNTPSTEATEQEAIAPIGATTAIGGRVTYDRVAFEGRNYRGLDYNNTTITPARSVTVQAFDQQAQLLATTLTDQDGRYSLVVAQDTPVQIKVVAEISGQTQASWVVQVKDNTNGNAQYILEGSLASSGDNTTQTRDLHAASGWDGSSYSGTRSAAPFAILDSVFDAVSTLIAVEPNVVLPPLSIFWSPRNIAISGNSADGNIGTSYYTSAGPAIYLLGAQNNDSDEYDRAVIQHEFGHYIEHQLGRTESIGGSHNQSSRLDIRVAFGEAWGNAFAGMASGDPVYRDSFGASQSLAFAINVEKRGYGDQGWYSEASIQAILYDLFDDADDGSDTLALGFGPIFRALTSADYLDFNGFASVYPFLASLKQQQPEASSAIDQLSTSFNIYGHGWFGEGETNNGGSAVVLPIYRESQLSQTVNVCSDSDYQDYNGMDVRRFIRVTLPQTRNYTIQVVKTSGGLAKTNPQVRIFKQGNEVGSILNGTANSENAIRHLSAGETIFEIYEEANVDNNDDNSGLACFDVTVE